MIPHGKKIRVRHLLKGKGGLEGAGLGAGKRFRLRDLWGKGPWKEAGAGPPARSKARTFTEKRRGRVRRISPESSKKPIGMVERKQLDLYGRPAPHFWFGLFLKRGRSIQSSARLEKKNLKSIEDKSIRKGLILGSRCITARLSLEEKALSKEKGRGAGGSHVFTES